ncbi:hypothetical protein AGR1_08500 [Agrobacterium sp. B1(2019)]|nr:hypothetical protein AGR1_08500 [Agrobacterium sp. B1(2019)]
MPLFLSLSFRTFRFSSKSEPLCLFVFSHFRTQNRFALLLECSRLFHHCLLAEAIVRTCRLLRLFRPFVRQVFPALLMSSLCHRAFNTRLKGMINGQQTNCKRLVKLGFY